MQALKFGAHLASPCAWPALRQEHGVHVVTLADGTEIRSRAVVVATGAAYRNLPLERWEEFVGSGIYYAATDLEAQTVAGWPVTVVGGANSAGQAALYLARHAVGVTLAVRGQDLGPGCRPTWSTGSAPIPRITCGPPPRSPRCTAATGSSRSP